MGGLYALQLLHLAFFSPLFLLLLLLCCCFSLHSLHGFFLLATTGRDIEDIYIQFKTPLRLPFRFIFLSFESTLT